MTSGSLLVNGHRYSLEMSGRGEPLLLLHGFSGDKSAWAALRPGLESQYRVIAVDILGHGASDKPAQVGVYRMGRVAGDIISLLDALRLPACHALGYSMGGRLALYLSLRFPARFRSLILESASPGIAVESERTARRRQDEALAARIEQRGSAWFVDYWQSLPLWKSQRPLPAHILQAQRQQRLGNDAGGLANSLRGLGSGAQPNLWPHLGQAALPTLLLAGELDQKFVALNQLMEQQMPQSELQVIPQAGHNIHLERSALFLARVKAFLRAHSQQNPDE